MRSEFEHEISPFSPLPKHPIVGARSAPSKTAQFCAKTQRRPVLRPKFAAEHAGLLGFGSRGPRRGLYGRGMKSGI